MKDPTESRIVQAMKQLGFNESDGKILLSLLKNNPATGYDLAARSGVPRSAIYSILKRLESLGLINRVQKKPAKYVPLDRDRLIQLIEARFTRNLEDLKDSMSNLEGPPSDITTWNIQGYNQMLAQAQSMISRSEKSVYASIWRREAERLAKPLQEAAESGIDVVLFSFTTLPQGLGDALSYDIDEAELERYWPHKLILLSDQGQALVSGAEQTEDNRGVLTEEMVVVEVAISNLVLDITLFGDRTGRDVQDIITRLTSHLAPVEDLLPKALSEKLSG